MDISGIVASSKRVGPAASWLLVYLKNKGGKVSIRMEDLADEMGIDQATVAGYRDRLKAAGLINYTRGNSWRAGTFEVLV